MGRMFEMLDRKPYEPRKVNRNDEVSKKQPMKVDYNNKWVGGWCGGWLSGLVCERL